MLQKYIIIWGFSLFRWFGFGFDPPGRGDCEVKLMRCSALPVLVACPVQHTLTWTSHCRSGNITGKGDNVFGAASCYSKHIVPLWHWWVSLWHSSVPPCVVEPCGRTQCPVRRGDGSWLMPWSTHCVFCTAAALGKLSHPSYPSNNKKLWDPYTV